MKNRHISGVLSAIIMVCIFSAVTAADKSHTVFYDMPVSGKVIILDPGHGGWDPGKAGSNGEDEKDINLKIAEDIKDYLEQGGAVVYMTRTEDEALGKTKNEDMKNRISSARKGEADIFISIHQNSFPAANVKGAQVFYHKTSEDGKRLAQNIQDRLVSFADNDNKRIAKENDSYYILKKTDIAAVIIECGFLSNAEEEKKLNSEDYRSKIAWAVYMGIWDYFEGENFT